MTNSSTVNPSEVGWQFVPQYYTFVNKHPNRLHCFYTKASTFIHGTEGEDGKPCLGQAEIHSKITSIGFQDCKVFIHSVDAQSSANGGIIIQVIGEMSNKGEAWKKFVQTFFLAEQPNGYFVLNDIFRFLKEESVEDGDEPEADVTAPTAPDHAPPAPASPAPPPPVEPEPVPTPTPPPAPVVEDRAPSPVPAPSPQVNGHAPEIKPEPVASREPTPAPAPEPASTASPAPVSPAPPPPQQLAPPPAAPVQPPQQPPPPVAAAPAPAPIPVAPASSAPKSWASLAATGAKGWGSAVASQSRGTSEAPAPTSSASPAPGPQPPAPQRPPVTQGHPAYIAAQTVATPQCFVKSVTENVPDPALRQVLTSRFGPIKELEIVRNKACAFLEFHSLDAAKRAITASLPVAQGGEGGIRIETDGGAGQARIIVETRKERGERPPPRGPPINGDRGRGTFRGRGGPGGRGRGGPPPKA
ncbi:hypothetical protein LXA43DRAFT_996823 [Ganoderma leucocontextum]|nr:hypothetical protein LXA43DRAFT_996823 [Ganoderma leucocontextum]